MPFDWPAMLTRNRADLARLVMVLFRLAGVIGDQVPVRLSYSVRLAVLRMLRPAEAAMRRLIVVAARGVEVAQPVPRKIPAGGIARGAGERPGVFPLFDPRRAVGVGAAYSGGRTRGAGPQIRFLDEATAPAPQRPVEDVDAAPLLRRLARLERALERLPAEARRLVRWRMRHPAALKRPMRPGRPPGFRAHAGDDFAQEVLRELQLLALFAMTPEKA